MPRTLTLIAFIGLAVLLAAGGYVAVRPGPPGVAPAPMARDRTASTGTPSGRVFSIDAAVKELDLIRPPKLKPTEDFSIPLTGDRTFRLSDQRGKVVFVNFWATWCPPCREEMPAMERLYARHHDKGFTMLAVSVDADPAVVRPFVAAGRFTFAVGLDPKMTLANTYGVRALPSSFIIDAQGNLAALALGPRAWDSEASHALVSAMAP